MKDEKIIIFINEIGIVRTFNKLRMREHVFKELNIGFDTTDTEFFQTAQHLGNNDFVR